MRPSTRSRPTMARSTSSRSDDFSLGGTDGDATSGQRAVSLNETAVRGTIAGMTVTDRASLDVPAAHLLGWDCIEWWVGNARAFSGFLMAAFGFECTAYAGPETGVRDKASYVLEQG